MKVRESLWHEAAKADKKEKPNWTDEARRQKPIEYQDALNKGRQTDSVLKEDVKFSAFLETTAKPHKAAQQDDSKGGSEDDDSKEKRGTQDSSATDNLTSDGKTEKHGSFGGNAGGGAQNGFGMGASVNQLDLNENFAARSILHIADLERLISTIKTQYSLGGRREIVLQLKRSVLEGLKVRIVTDPGARVQIDFLAANEKVRSEIEKHTPELAEILRGRGINLASLRATLEHADDDGNGAGDNVQNSPTQSTSPNTLSLPDSDNFHDNTFSDTPVNSGKNYNA